MGSKEIESADFMERKSAPPKQLRPIQIPQFILIGLDDNHDIDAVQWCLSLAKTLSEQYQKKINFTFFNSTSNLIASTPSEQVNVFSCWKQITDSGHELANHTHYHSHSEHYGDEDWIVDISKAESYFKVADKNINFNSKGFRSPYLEFNLSLFPVLKSLGFLYDSSIQEGWEGGFDEFNQVFPYTLDGANFPLPETFNLDTVSGLWEVPIQKFATVQSEFICGFDFSLWQLENIDEIGFLEILKTNLTRRIQGNRAPLVFGVHSHLFFDRSLIALPSIEKRQDAFKQFLEFALSQKDVHVEVVSYARIIEWMKCPIPYTDSPVLTIKGNIVFPIFLLGWRYQKGETVKHLKEYYQAVVSTNAIPSNNCEQWLKLNKADVEKLKSSIKIEPKPDNFGDILLESDETLIKIIVSDSLNTSSILVNGNVLSHHDTVFTYKRKGNQVMTLNVKV